MTGERALWTPGIECAYRYGSPDEEGRYDVAVRGRKVRSATCLVRLPRVDE